MAAKPDQIKVLHYWVAGNMSVGTDSKGRLWVALDAATAPKWVMLGQLNTDRIRTALGV